MLHRPGAAAVALLALAACASEPKYSGRFAEVTLLTREQAEILERSPAPDTPEAAQAREQLVRELGATAYVVDEQVWLESDADRLFQDLRRSERAGDEQRARALRLELLELLEPHRVTEGRTPITRSLPQYVHVFVARRDAALERAAFNPLHEREVVVELRPQP